MCKHYTKGFVFIISFQYSQQPYEVHNKLRHRESTYLAKVTTTINYWHCSLNAEILPLESSAYPYAMWPCMLDISYLMLPARRQTEHANSNLKLFTHLSLPHLFLFTRAVPLLGDGLEATNWSNTMQQEENRGRKLRSGWGGLQVEGSQHQTE